MNYETIHSSGRSNVRNPRFLVVANETIEGASLQRIVKSRAAGAPRAELLVIAPALNSRLRYWLSDEDDARRGASIRLAESLESLRAAGIEAAGRIGDADPMQAVADALNEYGADQIVIPSSPDERSHWLARDLVERARRRFAQPVVRVVVEHRENPVLVAPSTAKPHRQPAARKAITARAQEAGT